MEEMCCQNSQQIYDGAKELGASPDELAVFRELFTCKRKYFLLRDDNPFFRKEERQFDIDELIEQIRGRAELFSSAGVKEYFLRKCPEYIKYRNTNSAFPDRHEARLAQFNLKWKAQFPEKPNPPASQEPTTKIWALHYWYLWRAGYMPELGNDSGKKKATLEALAPKHGISSQKFYRTFNAIDRQSNLNPLKVPILEQAISTLEAFPEARRMAENDLKQRREKKLP